VRNPPQPHRTAENLTVENLTVENLPQQDQTAQDLLGPSETDRTMLSLTPQNQTETDQIVHDPDAVNCAQRERTARDPNEGAPTAHSRVAHTADARRAAADGRNAARWTGCHSTGCHSTGCHSDAPLLSGHSGNSCPTVARRGLVRHPFRVDDPDRPPLQGPTPNDLHVQERTGPPTACAGSRCLYLALSYPGRTSSYLYRTSIGRRRSDRRGNYCSRNGRHEHLSDLFRRTWVPRPSSGYYYGGHLPMNHPYVGLASAHHSTGSH
jgi:hypothetical protein